MKRELFKTHDGKEINVAYWDEVESPKGLIQLIHGMAEHVERYAEFAAFMNKRGYIVVGDDHRAHGLTDKNGLGLKGEGDLFKNTVEDEKELTGYLSRKYELPIYIFGHSYGSFITQKYLTEESSIIKGAVICGSALMKGLKIKVGYKLASAKCKKDENGLGDLFAKMTFESYDKKIGEGKNAWLSFNKDNVATFNNDELCGFVCSNGFYKSFFNGLNEIAKSKWEISNKKLPLLVIAGSEDPVGENGKLVTKLYKRLKKNGNNVTLKLIENARHEILNEYNKAETFSFIYNFIKNCE